VLLPAEPEIELTGGLDFNDHQLIRDRLGSRQAPRHGPAAWWLAQGRRTHRRQMGDEPQGAADRLQADWAKHAKAATFWRNDAMLALVPIGIMVFPGTGIQDNFVDKARRLGIPVWQFSDGA